nr:hypothetical protein [Tanacetum cinerariifolium]
GKRESYKHDPKEEVPAPKALMVIGIRWDWSYMANEEENHALVADDEVPIEFDLMDKSSSSSESKVEARLVEFKEQEIMFCEKLEVKKEKEGLDNKLIGFENGSKDLDNLLGSQRSDKNKEGLRYNVVPPTHVYLVFASVGITSGGAQHMRSLIIGAKDKGKEKVVESEVPKKRKLQEQIDAQ